MRTSKEDAECKRVEKEFEDLCARVCEKVERAANCGSSTISLSLSDLRQLLYVLAIRPFRALTMEEALIELRKEAKAERSVETLDLGKITPAQAEILIAAWRKGLRKYTPTGSLMG